MAVFNSRARYTAKCLLLGMISVTVLKHDPCVHFKVVVPTRKSDTCHAKAKLFELTKGNGNHLPTVV